MSANPEEMADSPFERVEGDGDPAQAGGGEGGPLDRLLDGDAPGPAVGELRADYDMPQWMAVTARGVLRVATGSGIPPVFEIVVGAVMGLMGTDAFDGFGGGEDTNGGDDGDLPDPDDANPPPVQ